MTRVFKTRHFQRWMRKTGLTDAVLCKAVQDKAADLLARTNSQLDEAVADGALLEICQ